MRGVAAVFFALPEEEAHDFVFFRAWVVGIEVGEDFFRPFDVVVILFSGISNTLGLLSITLWIIRSAAVFFDLTAF